MTDIPNARHNSPCCKDAGMRKDEYDNMDVQIEGRDATIPVYTCKECGNKYAIEKVVEKIDEDVKELLFEIPEILQDGKKKTDELFDQLDAERSDYKDAVKALENDGMIETTIDRELKLTDFGRTQV